MRPVLTIWGRKIDFIVLPYKLLEILIPVLKLGGVPLRFTVMVFLSASLICSTGFGMLLLNSKKTKLLALVLLVIMFIEYLPSPLPNTRLSVPKYVFLLKKLSDEGGVIDVVNRPTFILFFQTIHEKPVAFGYIARIPKSVMEKNEMIYNLIKERNFKKLHDNYNFKYLVATSEVQLPFKVLYRGKGVRLYDISISK